MPITLHTRWLTAALLLAASAGGAVAEADPTGVWLDDRGRGAIEIAPCGKALCGRVVWVKSEKDRKGCGEQILGSVKPYGNGVWSGGWIYSPDHGRKFDVELKKVGEEKLRVVGWAGIRLFSETRYWKKAPDDLARCDGQQVATAPATEAQALTTGSLADAPPLAAAPVPVAKRAAPASAAGASAPAAAPDAAGATPPPAAPTTVAAPLEEDDDPPPTKTRRGSYGGLPPIDKFVSRSKNGTCKLDTPWIQVKFNCKNL